MTGKNTDEVLESLLRAWREDIDSEPFPAITDVVLPRQRHPGDPRRVPPPAPRPEDPDQHTTST